MVKHAKHSRKHARTKAGEPAPVVPELSCSETETVKGGRSKRVQRRWRRARVTKIAKSTTLAGLRTKPRAGLRRRGAEMRYYQKLRVPIISNRAVGKAATKALTLLRATTPMHRATSDKPELVHRFSAEGLSYLNTLLDQFVTGPRGYLRLAGEQARMFKRQTPMPAQLDAVLRMTHPKLFARLSLPPLD